MDLNNFKVTESAESGAQMQLEHPFTGEPMEGMFITLLGKDSAAFRSKQRDLTNKRVGKLARGRSSDLVTEEERCELMASVTVSWVGLMENGVELECNASNAKKLYMAYPWILEQVDVFVGDRLNFFTKS